MNGGDTVASLKAVLTVETDRATRSINAFKTSFEGVKQSLSRAKQSFSDAQATIDHFGNNVTRVVGLVKSGFDQLNEGARRIEIRQAFAEQLGGSEQVVQRWLSTLNDAAGGTISEFNLISSASKAMSLGVTSDLSEMQQLLEIARYKARKFGTDTATAFEDISVGVGRQSKLILDNLGIVVEIEQAYAEYAASVNKVVSELTDAEKKQAFLNAVLREGGDEIARAGGLVDTQADKLRGLQVEWDKAVAAAQKYAAFTAGRQITSPEGENQVEGLFEQAAAYDLIAAATGRARQELTALNEGYLSVMLLTRQSIGNYDALYVALQQNSDAQREFRTYILANYEAFGLTRIQAEELAYGYVRLTDAIIDSNYGLQQQAAIIEGLTGAQGSQTRQTDKATMAIGDYGVIAALARGETAALATQAAILAGELYGVANAANTATYAMGSTFGRGDLNAIRNKVGSPIWEGFESGKGLGGSVGNRIGGNVSAFQATQAAITNVGRAGVSAVDRQAQEVERIWNSLISEVQGGLGSVLNFSTSVGQHDALLDQFGLRRQLESTETARQLADIRDRALEGQRSPWLAMFPEADAADMQEIAARAEALIRDLSSGRRFDLLDRNTVKQDLKTYIAEQRAAQAWKDALVAEVAAELGTGTQQVDDAVSNMLGIASTNAGGVAGGDVVNSMAASMKAAAEAKTAELEMVGESMGMAMGTGTLRGFNADAIIAGFIDKMTAAFEAA